MFILICSRKDLSLLLLLLYKLDSAIFKVLIITNSAVSNTFLTVFIFSLFLEEEDSDQSLDIRIIVADDTLNVS